MFRFLIQITDLIHNRISCVKLELISLHRTSYKNKLNTPINKLKGMDVSAHNNVLKTKE